MKLSREQIIEGLEAMEALNDTMVIKSGYMEVEGGYNAVIIFDNGQMIQFGKPVFKSKQKANAYARRKSGEAIAHLAKKVAEYGFATVVDSELGKGNKKQ